MQREAADTPQRPKDSSGMRCSEARDSRRQVSSKSYMAQGQGNDMVGRALLPRAPHTAHLGCRVERE